MTPTERRAHVRVEVLFQLHAQIVSSGIDFIIYDLSTGGFSVDDHTYFPPGARHRFRFTLPDKRTVFASARAVRSQALSNGRYRSGFAFVADPGRVGSAVGEVLMGAVKIAHVA